MTRNLSLLAVLCVFCIIILFQLNSFVNDRNSDHLAESKYYHDTRRRPAKPKCFAAPEHPQDRRTDKKHLSIANYNVEWLFWEGGSPATPCPGRGCTWKTRQAAEKHFNRVAKVIIGMELPDIVHLSEVEGCIALEKLIQTIDKQLPEPSRYKYYLLEGTDTALGQNVGILTKIDPIQSLERTSERSEYPVPGSRCNYTDPGDVRGNYGVSKHYFTQFVVNNITIHLNGNHLLAFPDRADRCEKREAQATIIQNHHKKYSSDHELVILGDFNDYDELVLDPAGSLDYPMSDVLSILRRSRQPELFNVANLFVSQDEKYSVWYDRNKNCVDDLGNEHVLIDHVLVSSGLKDKIVEAHPFHRYKEYCGTFDSDHWPQYVRFDLTKK